MALLAVTVIAGMSAALWPGLAAEAARGDGPYLQRADAGSLVCGDRLCSEIVQGTGSGNSASGATGQAPEASMTGSIDPVCSRNDGVTRTYYIAADEVVWDYTPLGLNGMKGTEFNEDENVFVENGPDRIGSQYIKAVYRQYTDGTFSELQPVPSEWEHLGTLGPVIHAEVCDTVKVVFKNNAETMDYSMHPHGVFYDKDSEGSGYNDGTSGSDKAGDAVAPGQTHTYMWPVPSRAGPGPNDPSSIIWMYHSHVDSPMDTNSGLVGPMVVTAKGMANADGTPRDVDRQIISLFTVSDENSSHYLCDNMEMFTDETCDNEDLVGDDDFAESNLMHGINGFMYGNQPGTVMQQDERVRWYLIGMGTEVDLHTPHWHGNTVLWNGNRADVVELMPGSLKTVDMVPDNAGTWMFHCHVNDHISAGMMSHYMVV